MPKFTFIVITKAMGLTTLFVLFSACAQLSIHEQSIEQASFEKASEYFRQYDYQKGIEVYKQLATAGDLKAQKALGYLYTHGLYRHDVVEVNSDSEQALYWYLMAAEQGDFQAQLIVARILKSSGDYMNAITWYEKLASAGDRNAQRELAVLLRQETYWYKQTEQNYQKAMQWLEKAGEQEDPDALWQLCSSYYSGSKLVKLNYTKAVYWCKKASAQYPAAMYYLGEMYFLGRGVEKNYQRAREYFFQLTRKQAPYDSPQAKYYLGKMYFDGLGVQVDRKKALVWYEDAATQKLRWHLFTNKQSVYADSRAQIKMGDFYWKGLIVKKNIRQALYWYRLAQGQNHLEVDERIKRAEIELMHEIEKADEKRVQAKIAFDESLKEKLSICVQSMLSNKNRSKGFLRTCSKCLERCKIKVGYRGKVQKVQPDFDKELHACFYKNSCDADNIVDKEFIPN